MHHSTFWRCTQHVHMYFFPDRNLGHIHRKFPCTSGVPLHWPRPSRGVWPPGFAEAGWQVLSPTFGGTMWVAYHKIHGEDDKWPMWWSSLYRHPFVAHGTGTGLLVMVHFPSLPQQRISQEFFLLNIIISSRETLLRMVQEVFIVDIFEGLHGREAYGTYMYFVAIFQVVWNPLKLAVLTLFVLKMTLCFVFTSGETRLQTRSWKWLKSYIFLFGDGEREGGGSLLAAVSSSSPCSNTGVATTRMALGRLGRGVGFPHNFVHICLPPWKKKTLRHSLTHKESAWLISVDCEQLETSHQRYISIRLPSTDPFIYGHMSFSGS